jgi:transcriptional regulator with XRE-family HTH domain
MATALGLHIGRRIRQARLDAGLLTQQALADKLPGAANNQYVSKWENGVKPSEENLALVAAATGKEVAWFYDGFQRNGTPDVVGKLGGDASQLDRIEEHLMVVLGVLEQRVGAALFEGVRQDIQQRRQQEDEARRRRPSPPPAP